ncbi:MAG TPA: hypothetical protein VGG32_06000 [Thermoplasmata archaeon]|jgi:hypothetical protein
MNPWEAEQARLDRVVQRFCALPDGRRRRKFLDKFTAAEIAAGRDPLPTVGRALAAGGGVGLDDRLP